MRNFVYFLALITFLFIPAVFMGQTKTQPITFHITNVEKSEGAKKDWCMSSACLVTRWVVDAYVERTQEVVQYRLECFEVRDYTPRSNTSEPFVFPCAQLHATGKYPGFVDGSAYILEQSATLKSGYIRPFEILSERVVTKSKEAQ